MLRYKPKLHYRNGLVMQESVNREPALFKAIGIKLMIKMTETPNINKEIIKSTKSRRFKKQG